MNGRKISLLAVFIGLSVVGASLKIPAIIGSVALDAFPALLASVFFGGGAGAVVAGFGHMMSALIGGMPMGPLHFIVAIEMAALAFIFALTWRKKWVASTIFIIGNGLIAPLPFILFFDFAFYLALVPSLLVGAVINMAVALILIPRLQAFFQEAYQKGAVKG
jgi:hypothetical protein